MPRQKEKKEKKEKSKKKKRHRDSSDSDSSSEVPPRMPRMHCAATRPQSHFESPAEQGPPYTRPRRWWQDVKRSKSSKGGMQAPVSLSSFFSAGDSD